MTQSPRIYLVHAAAVAMPPIVASFREHWPQARTVNLLEDSLMTDLEADGRLTDEMVERFVDIGRYCVKAGADAILFTCSAYVPAIDEVRSQVTIPVLKPNEALYQQLVAKDGAVGGNPRHRSAGFPETADLPVSGHLAPFPFMGFGCLWP